jgi:periplasmic protein TonB
VEIPIVFSPPVIPARAAAPAPAAAGTHTEVVNQAEVQRELQRAWPPLLRDAGIGGVAMLWLFIDENGRALRMQVAASSGRAELDEAALGVATTMRFRPIVRDGAPVQVWVVLPPLAELASPRGSRVGEGAAECGPSRWGLTPW